MALCLQMCVAQDHSNIPSTTCSPIYYQQYTIKMSLYRLAGIDLQELAILKERLPGVMTRSKADLIISCSLCRRAKREEMRILINHSLIQDTTLDIAMICKRCRDQGQAKDQPVVKLKHLAGAITAILDQQLGRYTIPILDKVVQSVCKAKTSPPQQKKQNYDPQELTRYLVFKLIGSAKNESQTEEVQHPTRKTCHLIKDFYNDLSRSEIARLYLTLFGSQIRLNSTMINFLRVFCERERAFKADVLTRMASLAEQTRDPKDLWRWMRRGVDGLQRFSTAFAATPRNLQRTLFSVGRSGAQFRYIYHQDEKEAQCELLATEFPFTKQPSVFRVTSFGFEDQVEIGLFFAKRELSQGIQAGCQPLLFRFQIGIEKSRSREKAQTKKAVSADSRHRLERICKGYNTKAKILQKKQQKQQQKQQKDPKQQELMPIFAIQDEDQIEFCLDYENEAVRINNRSHNELIYECTIRSCYTVKYFIFPCVRLIGTKIMVESLPPTGPS